MNYIFRISLRSRFALYLMVISLMVTGIGLFVSWYADGGAPYIIAIAAACAACAALLMVTIQK
ncbi:hypothetical protein [uncultured Acetobacteroides sp.]|uniref:hypothetical protein n=1 Tax=uncultured Acetobacteroides sp. TaxID=1760811 RepID=UPI0029F5BB8C|nr:hypothetical protein [uncultured Acetobacteroides sp.]